jgi:GT2 family glycosyltransferase
MISIVYSTREDDPLFTSHLNKTTVGDIEILQYINNGEYSLTELYNKGLQESTNDVVVFCHDDIILKSGWDKKILNHFSNTDYGILGMAGTTDIDESGQWWKDTTKMVGIVKHSSDGKTWESKYSNNFGKDIIQTIMLDGLFFAVHKDRIKKNFNEEIKGFHFYDFDFTFGNHLEGVKVGVMFDVKITHKSVGQTNDQWDKNRLQFCNLYADHLPHNLSVELMYEEKVKKWPKKLPSVAVVIPTKGNVEMLKECVDSIFNKDPYVNLKVYIADTGSTDDEKEFIKQDIIFANSIMSDRPRNIELIEYDYYNFASINNSVVRDHVDDNFELLLFCNNDIKLVNDAITRMVNTYNQNKKTVGTIGARLHFRDNKIQHSGISVFLNQQPQTGAYFPALTHYGLNSYHTYHTGKKEVLGNTAAFMMISRTLFDNIGGFSLDYNECFEDVQLNIDCLQRNKKNIFQGDAVCYHYESQTRNKSDEKQRRESADYLKIIPYIIQNNKTYNYFSNVKADVLTQILTQQTREINTLVKR